MAKQPSFQFYPGDWLKDPALRRCSTAARGAFIDLLCYAFECEPRGFLVTNEEPWDDKCCAKVVGCRVTLVQQLLREGVLKTDDKSGAYFSKRMVEDERIRRLRADSGHKGGKQTPSKKPKNRKQKAPPSSSSSSSTSVSAPKGASLEPAARPRNVVWDCIVSEFYVGLDTKKIPKTTATRIGKVVATLKAFTDCTPEEICVRRRRMVKEFGPKGDTPESLAKHWAKFGGDGGDAWFDDLKNGAR